MFAAVIAGEHEPGRRKQGSETLLRKHVGS